MHFCFITTFTPLQKEEIKKEKIKTKKLSQFLKVHISETPGANLKCEVVTLAGISTAKIALFH